MKNSPRRVFNFILAIAIFSFTSLAIVPITSAQGIIPAANPDDCKIEKGRPVSSPVVDALRGNDQFAKYVTGDSAKLRSALGCAIKTGKVSVFMVPFFITYLIQFLLTIAGLISVLFIVIGGYKYVLGGVSEDKEAGKKTILHAIVGLLVSLSAWIVVNLIQIALTS